MREVTLRAMDERNAFRLVIAPTRDGSKLSLMGTFYADVEDDYEVVEYCEEQAKALQELADRLRQDLARHGGRRLEAVGV